MLKYSKYAKYVKYALSIGVFALIYLNATKVAGAVDNGVDYLQVAWESFFEAIRTGILAFLSSIEWVLFFGPPLVVVIIVMILGYLATKNIPMAVGFGAMMLLINAFGYWDLTVYTVAMVIAAVIISLIFGIPAGIIMASSRTVSSLMQPVLDTMQTLPSFVYLIPAAMFFSIGKAPGLIATIIYAIPPVIRLTAHAIHHVDADMREAARAFGATKWQSIFKVEIPQAMPTILAGINQTTMMAVAMVVTSSLIGAKGLGQEVLTATNRMEAGRGLIAGMCIVFVAIIIDRISQGFMTSSGKFKGGKNNG